MVFSSLLFMFVYLPIVLAIYYIVPKKWRNIWLFIVNLVFYAWGEPVYIFLMLFSILFNYIIGIVIDQKRDDRKSAKRWLIVCIVVNLGLLGFFKYYDLFAETIYSLTGLYVPSLGLTLPIGISFYTFQTMSYPIDIYRGDTKVQKNFISFGTFVALFPQLIAGPIVRYKDIAEQLDGRGYSIEQFTSGVRRFVVGLGKKVLIANNIGMLWSAYKAMELTEVTTLGAWMGIVAFSLQIYFDFSGYSDMAIGLGRMLGFEFLENFNYPYIAKSVTDFWRRWHISLSSWFRDYVYIPLGGNRKGLPRQLLNLLIVWSLTGFWHGANWNFLFWGIYYAVFLIIEKTFLLKGLNRAPAFVGHIYAVVVAICGWVMFDLDTFGHAIGFYKAMFGFGAGAACTQDMYYLRSFLAVIIVACVASTPLGKLLYNKLSDKVKSIVTPILIVLCLIFSTAYLVDATYNPFLYFRF